MSIVTQVLAAFFPPRCEPISELIAGRRALVRGKVVSRDLIESTLTGEPCVYYRYSVEAQRESTMAGLGSEGYWTPTRFDEAIVEFYLQDEAGDRLIVAPHRVRVERGRREPAYVDMGVLGQRAHELIIRPGDVLEVQGLVASVHDLYDEDRDYRSNASRYMMCAGDNDVLQIRLNEVASKS